MISGSGSFIQNGTGSTRILYLKDSYTGTTAGNAGTLKRDFNSLGDHHGHREQSGDAESGSGTIAGPVNVMAGGIVSPGAD